ncbi:MAG: choice-of-anchor V domain-containing protein [Saprospiraceae bacterium]
MKKMLLFVLAIVYLILSLSNLDGAFPENTGAPNELTCGRAPCHNVPVNVGSAQMSLTFNGIGQQYFADSVYLLTVTITNSQTMRNGFEILALNESLQNTGTWQLLEPSKMKIINGIGLPNRKYVTHKAAGNLQTEWIVAWKAPSTDVGKVKFYASVNATNNDGLNTGDEVYTKSIEVTFASVNTVKDVSLRFFKVYPSIANTGIWVEFPKDMSSAQASLFDSAGRQVIVKDLPQGKQHFIEINGLRPGVYFLKLHAEGHQAMERIVVQ